MREEFKLTREPPRRKIVCGCKWMIYADFLDPIPL